MQVKKFLLIGILLSLSSLGWTQSSQPRMIWGRVQSASGQPLSGLHIRLQELQRSTRTDDQGLFSFPSIPSGTYTLHASGVGYRAYQQVLKFPRTDTLQLILSEQAQDLKNVTVSGKSEMKRVVQQGFSVEAIDAVRVQNRTIAMNRLLDQTMGLQVRETGGTGSDFTYSIHGLSGKAVKFFLDGIPMESFGSSYRINNLPINLVDRIEVYKGVTPIELGSDALGGAVNIIRRQDVNQYLDASYSIGSFRTHQAALNGRYRHPSSGFTWVGQASYSSSANTYKVWGPTIEIAGDDGRPLPNVGKLRRFNDDFQSINARFEVGFTQVKWADQLLLSLTGSNLEKGIQTGRTMAFVYGKVRYKESFLMPGLTFAKKNFLTQGLSVKASALFNRLTGMTIDTSSQKYNWLGKVIASNVNGELGGIRSQKSRYTFNDRTALVTLNATYSLAAHHTLRFNYTGQSTRRTGMDALATAEWTIPFREPQHLNKQISALSYELTSTKADKSLTLFAKHYHYSARTNLYDYQGSSQKQLIANYQHNQTWSFGLAARTFLTPTTLLKASTENATRLPEAAELLGDGNTILNAVNLKPERSFNVNTSLQKQYRWKLHQLDWSTGLFYRFTRDLIWLGEADLFGTARYENLNRIQSAGIETEARYRYNQWLSLTANVTYQDLRNKLKYTSTGARNIVYNDRLRNTPYLLANAEAEITKRDFLQKGSSLSVYVSTHYVPQYFLGWPSLGARATKKVIPTQFVQDAGVNYTTPSRRYTLGLDCRNLGDRQVYDNYLLQKPGRFISLKIRYFISK
ncbi:hypothetical protein BWI96_07485 [Siphonobacter sp. SORGH_AS_0500]|uniref:TonB-dependent receptor n=1 Tax=Siphonobacter sp. SORGH_AS_0500 TaxID=1864824 RepID=UPI000CAEC182|nr:TonB-dependent receptor [Siphonobacter sp. SORGH_AS_0500]PKK37187.1 hypothetical protein BWI96_07485 [Siphonobacter sp. SORGH_AS_0500]